MPGNAAAMKEAIEKFVYYLRYERNASPSTLRDYRFDIEQFCEFLTPPGEPTLPLDKVDHRVIREFVSWLWDRRLEKASVARRLAVLRTFFKYCVREKYAKQNPARLVSTPKLPKRVPRVLTADELNDFLDSLGKRPGREKIRRKRPRRRNPRKKRR